MSEFSLPALGTAGARFQTRENLEAEVRRVVTAEAASRAAGDAALQISVDALSSGLRPRGEWDASSGAFPTGTIAAGDFWIVSTGGTVDSVAFAALDRLVSLGTGGATYSGNWVNATYSDVLDGIGDALVTPTGGSEDSLADHLGTALARDQTGTRRWLGSMDSDLLTRGEVARFRVTSEDNNNALVAATRTGDTNSFPTALTGLAYVKDAGKVAFPLYTEARINAAGVAVAEVDAFNYSAAPPDSYPPNRSFGTTQHLAIALSLGAGGDYQCYAALQIHREGSDPNTFVFGIGIDADAVTDYGIYIDATASAGADNPILARMKNGAVGLTLQTTAGAAATDAVMQVIDSAGDLKFAIRANGSINLPISIGVAAAGAATLPANPVGFVQIEVAGVSRLLPYYAIPV